MQQLQGKDMVHQLQRSVRGHIRPGLQKLRERCWPTRRTALRNVSYLPRGAHPPTATLTGTETRLTMPVSTTSQRCSRNAREMLAESNNRTSESTLPSSHIARCPPSKKPGGWSHDFAVKRLGPTAATHRFFLAERGRCPPRWRRAFLQRRAPHLAAATPALPGTVYR